MHWASRRGCCFFRWLSQLHGPLERRLGGMENLARLIYPAGSGAFHYCAGQADTFNR